MAATLAAPCDAWGGFFIDAIFSFQKAILGGLNVKLIGIFCWQYSYCF
ncbi:Uncharacterized protein ChrSV_2613 [Chromobacterium vaccinii]|nr:Uncharacterized protein ChrSW_2613 [Chromobacterium vaccinii]QND90070.1 Uncharacterized protein ChrSV_2613 [Chromobacterium vaccinii]